MSYPPTHLPVYLIYGLASTSFTTVAPVSIIGGQRVPSSSTTDDAIKVEQGSLFAVHGSRKTHREEERNHQQEEATFHRPQIGTFQVLGF